jgi:hypothetical protein
MKNILPFLLCLMPFIAFGQKSLPWKKHVAMADEFYVKSLYADAAEHYEAAWRQKGKKKDLIYKAAECYYIIKDYKKAASAFKNVKDEKKEYPLAGLRYARCLKQDGNYDEASREFVYFLNNYSGADKAVMSEIVQNEIRGCELGIKLTSEMLAADVSVLHLGTNINSPETEFAPIAFTDDVLYFSSTMSNKARIYFTMRDKGEDWKKAAPPKSFPEIPNEHYCNGSLSPDGKRFYFTICKSIESWGGLTTRCEINVIKKIGDTWTSPQRLRDYVNLEGYTTTHPNVIHKDGKEIIYFASNREGSIGGMDLWYIERNIESEDIDFTFPINLGPQINTLGDEITPFYDQQDGILYLSSNGHASIGGQDIFKSTGTMTTWSAPENIGLPFNSSTDDFFFVLAPSHKVGFLASNRLFGMEKITTTHEDLFEFRYKKTDVLAKTELPEPPKPPVVVAKPAVSNALKFRGTINDKDAEDAITNADISLFELGANNKKVLVMKVASVDGNVDFDLLPQKKYVLEVSKDGYRKSTLEFSTLENRSFEEDIFIEKVADVAEVKVNEKPAAPSAKDKKPETKPTGTTTPKPEANSAKPKVAEVATKPAIEVKKIKIQPPVTETKPAEDVSTETVTTAPEYTGSTYVTRGQSKFDNAEFSASAPRHQGVYFKIQIMATEKFNPEEARFQKLSGMGRVDTELLLEKKLNRVLVADFFNFEDAKKTLQEVKVQGFPTAFVVKYQDGERYGMVYR